MSRNILPLVVKTFVIIVMIFIAVPLSAQSSGDKLYAQGLELQKTQTVQSQKQAIAKFQSAKKLYDSAAKKKQCDNAIVVSNNIIKNLSQPSQATSRDRRSSNQNAPKTTEKKTTKLEVSNEKLQLDCEERSVSIRVTTNEDDWSVTTIANNDGEDFISIEQSKLLSVITVKCPHNDNTQNRSQTIEVRAGDLKKEIIVEQAGKPTILSVEKTVVEFTSKGGNKSVEVYSNSNTLEDTNNYRNWKVESKPDWINVIGEEVKEKGVLGKLGDKAKGLVKKAAVIEDPSVVVSVMKIVVQAKSKNERSRSGEVIINSGNQRATIIVQQN